MLGHSLIVATVSYDLRNSLAALPEPDWLLQCIIREDREQIGDRAFHRFGGGWRYWCDPQSMIVRVMDHHRLPGGLY